MRARAFTNVDHVVKVPWESLRIRSAEGDERHRAEGGDPSSAPQAQQRGGEAGVQCMQQPLGRRR